MLSSTACCCRVGTLHSLAGLPQQRVDVVLLCSKGPAFGLARSRGPVGDRLLAVLESRRAVVVDRHDMIRQHVTGASLQERQHGCCVAWVQLCELH